MGQLYTHLIGTDPSREKCGYILFMATHSKASISSFLSTSFCEKINSAGSLIIKKGNTERSMLTVLRENK